MPALVCLHELCNEFHRDEEARSCSVNCLLVSCQVLCDISHTTTSAALQITCMRLNACSHILCPSFLAFLLESLEGQEKDLDKYPALHAQQDCLSADGNGCE